MINRGGTRWRAQSGRARRDEAEDGRCAPDDADWSACVHRATVGPGLPMGLRKRANTSPKRRRALILPDFFVLAA